MNVYEALKVYDENKNKTKLSNAAKAMYLEILIIINKNFWKPTRIKHKEFDMAKGNVAKTRRELTEAGLVKFENNLYEIVDKKFSIGNQETSEESSIENRLTIENQESSIENDESSIENQESFIENHKLSIKNKRAPETLAKSGSEGLLNNKHINNINNNTSNEEDDDDDDDNPWNRWVTLADGRNVKIHSREELEKLKSDLPPAKNVPYRQQLIEYGRKLGYNWGD